MPLQDEPGGQGLLTPVPIGQNSLAPQALQSVYAAAPVDVLNVPAGQGYWVANLVPERQKYPFKQGVSG